MSSYHSCPKRKLEVPGTISNKRSLSETRFGCGQGQSGLLAVLPLEVRLQIWELVLGQEMLHVLRTLDRWYCFPCDSDEDWIDSGKTKVMNYIGGHSCWELANHYSCNSTMGVLAARLRRERLSLLRTCRQM
jgi:hypothetical protein